MEHVEQVLRRAGVIPVIALEDEAQAVPLGNALLEGGIPAAEITFRTSAAAKSIEKLAAALPEMFVCAGTVLSVEQARLAVDCGAQSGHLPGTQPGRGGVVREKQRARLPTAAPPPPRWRRLWAWA